MEAKWLVREVLADKSHLEIGSLAATELRGQREAIEPGGIGTARHVDQQLLPFAPGNAVVFDIGAGELPPVVKVLRVTLLERSELTGDELIDAREQRLDVTLRGWNQLTLSVLRCATIAG